MKDKLLAQVKAVEKIASMSKIARMLHNPAKYIFAILYRLTAYRLLKKEVLVKAKLFYGKTDLINTIGIMENAMAPMMTAAIITGKYNLNPKLGNNLVTIGVPISFITLCIWKLILT